MYDACKYFNVSLAKSRNIASVLYTYVQDKVETNGIYSLPYYFPKMSCCSGDGGENAAW